MPGPLADAIAQYVDELCTAYPDRHMGGPGNRAATATFADTVARFGFDVERSQFDCIDWEHGDVLLDVAGERFQALVGPYSLAADVEAILASADSVEDLETDTIRGAIVLMHGDLVRGQLMPKNFVFYNPESHRRIIRALEENGPAAVIAATGTNPELVGSAYPFPFIEDGDFDIPSAYMKDVEGERLLAHVGETAKLHFDSRRVTRQSEHVVATKAGPAPGRVVVFGHIDSKEGTPGALDNAVGVAALLGMAELLSDYSSGPTVELVPLNGEDYYAASGQMIWVAENEGRFGDIVLGANIDAAGWRGHAAHISTYSLPDATARIVGKAMEAYPSLAEGPPWPMSDHGIFIQHGCPTLAITSEGVGDLLAEIAHTERDVPALVDAAVVADCARFLSDVVRDIARNRDGRAKTHAGER
ncbi:MAG: M28 family peptidase [Coriobacteriia bacterium]|nr:M28 family peptidase [Coriobacteriia bacterium]